jgi:acid phosphatase family membrane protein YuiD
MLGGFISDARESAKIGKITEQVIKSTGGAANVTASQVSNLATAISNKTGADDEAVQSGANLLLTFTGIRNEAGKGNDIFNQTTQAATDMAAAMNDGKVTQEGVKSSAMMLGKALNDPIAGMSKLTKNGVSFTDQQKEQVKALVKSGDTLGAQKVILGEVGKEFGGAAAAASDPMDKLKTNVGNLGEAIGTALIPFVDDMTTKLSSLVNFVTANSSWLVPLVGSIAGLAGAAMLVVKAVRLWREVQMALNVVMAANPVVLIALAVAALVVVIVLIATKTDWFQKLWSAAWGLIHGAITTVWNWIKTNWPLILGFLTGPIGIAVVMIVKHWTTIKNAIYDAWNWIVKNVLDPVKNFFTVTIPNAAATLYRGVNKAWNDIKNAIHTAWRWIVNNVGAPINTFFTKTVPGYVTTLYNRVKTGWTNIYNWIKDKATAIYKWVSDKFTSMISFFSGLPKKMTNATKGLFDGIKNAFKSAINWVIGKWNAFSLGFSFTIPVIGKHISFSVSTPNIPLLAKGGVATGSGAAIVGENGPEMISMRRGAQVTPLSRAGGGGGPTHVVIEFKSTGNALMDKFLSEMQEAIRKRGGDVQAVIGS